MAKRRRSFANPEAFIVISLMIYNQNLSLRIYLQTWRFMLRISIWELNDFGILNTQILNRKMGTKLSLCEAISTPDVFVKLQTSEKELQKFLQKFPPISKILTSKKQRQVQKLTKNYPARKFYQGIYIGPVNANTLPHSSSSGDEGIFLYQAGFLYLGEMKNGKRTGEGILINQDGQYYIGDWSNNNPNGKGEYVSTESLRSYIGQWQEGLQHGKGIEKYDDKSVYEGDFVNGLKHGQGRLTYPDETYYQGQFLTNTITGKGICSNKFHRYEGEWQNGKMHGNGISKWSDQNGQQIGSYVGQYKQGLKHGYGEYHWGQKKIYKGKWEEGDMSSEGVLLNYEG